MSFRRRLTMWLRVTHLDRSLLTLAIFLIAVTLLAIVRGEVTSSLDWTACMRNWLLVAAAMAAQYGYSRASHFHPLLNKPYGEWLHDQPWLFPQPLPLGPWHFVAQDMLFVAILALVAMIGGIAFPLYFNTTPVNCT